MFIGVMIKRTFKKLGQLQKSYLKSKGVELILALEFYTNFFFESYYTIARTGSTLSAKLHDKSRLDFMLTYRIFSTELK